MSTSTLNKPGTLVNYRSRDWMVLPSDEPELMRIKPLGGSDEEETAIFLPLQIPGEEVKPSQFPEPTVDQIGGFQTARLLFDASRLSFRNASGPFRCMGKLSFRPRSYQLVPLVMSLKQELVRLMIADDVGIGKTVEALIVLKELMERGDIKRFAVVCPPHLCEQWAQELKDKLDIEAEVIRSSTAAKLDRLIPDDNSIFHHVPYQVVSIDYIKADKRRGIFINDCPDFLIVDEAHTCALPEGFSSKSAQQRYSLLHDLSKKKNRHILFLTATPHSGKDSEFLSLMGLLNPEFTTLNLDDIEDRQKRRLAEHFIQRKRERIKYWLNEHTLFPKRDPKEIGYQLTLNYHYFYQNTLRFAREISMKASDNEQTQMLRSWAAIALIRGVMSSPAMAIEMLQNRRNRLLEEDFQDSIPTERQTLFGSLDSSDDAPRKDLMDALPMEKDELDAVEALIKEASILQQEQHDQKLKTTEKIVKDWLKEGYNPIVFCQYIPTANYVGNYLKEVLPKNVHVEAITSELADEQRREKIAAMEPSEKRVLVATDCLSEGINLQTLFTAVLHYDLPWNPNRLEQREGRVDRFGQTAPDVKAYLLYGQDNPMDEFVMEVLIRKVKEIQKTTGVTIAIGEDSENLMTKAAKQILFETKVKDANQMRLFAEEEVSNELEQARKKGEKLKSIFAHENINPETIRKDLEAVDEAIGDVETVEHFVIQSLEHLGVSHTKEEHGYRFQTANLPAHLKNHFQSEDLVRISFESPTPRGYRYVGRNHLFVEQLCHFMLALAFDGHDKYAGMARVAAIQTDAVQVRTTLVMFRVRNVIKEVATKQEVISEEMYLWGYRGIGEQLETLNYTEGKDLLMKARSLVQISEERQKSDLLRELSNFDSLKEKFIEVATDRAEKLVEAHGRFKELVGGRRYEKATPVLPPDVMGVYILMPKPKAL